MTSEIRANTLKNRVGLGTIEYSNTGPVISGVTTSNNFKTGSTNVHSVGVEAAGINVLGADTPIGTGATIYNSGAAVFTGVVTATSFSGIVKASNLTANRVVFTTTGGQLEASGNLTYNGTTLASGSPFDINSDLDVDGHTNLDNVSVAGVSTFSGNVHLPDNVELNLGTNNDLEIFHNDNDAYVRNNKGALILRNNGQTGDADASQIYIQATPAENSISCAPNGAVTLYNDNDPKLATNAAGVILYKDLDVDGHTNLDNVSIAGVATVYGTSSYDILQLRAQDTNGIANLNIYANGTTGSSRILFSDTAASSGDGWISYSHNDRALTFTTAGTSNERLRITSDGALGIGNLQTAQNTSTTHTSKTKFYLDSTKFTKIARLAAGNISSAGWFTVAKIASSNGNYFKCYASIGGNFTQDMCVMELTGSWSASGGLSNAYAEPVFKAHRVGAHSTDRITRARFVKDSSNVTYLQIYIASGNSSYWGKSVLEYTIGAYSQNTADSGSAAMFEAGGSVTNIRTLEVDDNAICVSAGTHKFYSGGNATERLEITSGGDLRVTVANSSSYQMAMNLTNNINADINFYIKTNESLIAPSTNTPLLLGNGGVEKLRITSTGKVGVNFTATPPGETFMIRPASDETVSRVTLSHISSGNSYGARISTVAGTTKGFELATVFNSTYVTRARMSDTGAFQLSPSNAISSTSNTYALNIATNYHSGNNPVYTGISLKNLENNGGDGMSIHTTSGNWDLYTNAGNEIGLSIARATNASSNNSRFYLAQGGNLTIGNAVNQRLSTSRKGHTMLHVVGGGVSVGCKGNTATTVEGGRYVLGWYMTGYSSSQSYLHLITDLWAGGSPHNNNEYIMGGFHIHGHQYAGGQSVSRERIYFHNWSGSYPGYSNSNGGTWAPGNTVYTHSTGYVTLRLLTGSYRGYIIDLIQHAWYPTRDINVTSATYSNSTTL